MVGVAFGVAPGDARFDDLKDAFLARYAQRLLQEADVIVHDALVPTAVVDMGRRDAERISVGKQKGHHSFTQAEINALIVRLGKAGSPIEYLDAPEFQAYWDADAKAMAEAVKRIGKVE